MARAWARGTGGYHVNHPGFNPLLLAPRGFALAFSFFKVNCIGSVRIYVFLFSARDFAFLFFFYLLCDTDYVDLKYMYKKSWRLGGGLQVGVILNIEIVSSSFIGECVNEHQSQTIQGLKCLSRVGSGEMGEKMLRASSHGRVFFPQGWMDFDDRPDPPAPRAPSQPPPPPRKLSESFPSRPKGNGIPSAGMDEQGGL